MSKQLTTVHMLAGFAAELNEVEARLHEGLQTVSGLRSHVLYEISVLSRPVDPETPVDQGAPAPGKPPRPTEGGVIVTEELASSEEGGDGSADRGSGASVVFGGAFIVPQAGQALDGAITSEGAPTPADLVIAPGSIDYNAILLDYEKHGHDLSSICFGHALDIEDVRAAFRHARSQLDPRVMEGDAKRADRGLYIQ